MIDEETDHSIIHTRLRAIDHELGLLGQAQLELEKERLNLKRLLNPPVVILHLKTWAKVHQLAPCWRCGRNTEWRNPNGACEHLHSNCPSIPGGMSFQLSQTIKGLLDGSIDPDDYL